MMHLPRDIKCDILFSIDPQFRYRSEHDQVLRCYKPGFRVVRISRDARHIYRESITSQVEYCEALDARFEEVWLPLHNASPSIHRQFASVLADRLVALAGTEIEMGGEHGS